MAPLTTVTIPASLVPPSATYIADVLHYGHIPGVLSGANLKGKARKYGAHYARSRGQAMHIASQYGVKATYVLLDRGTPGKPKPRHCVVWAKDGAPAELVIS